MRLNQTCPFFAQKGREGGGIGQQQKKKKKEIDRCRCHAEPEGMLLRMSHSVRSYQQGLALRQPLQFLLHRIRGVNGEHSSWSCVFFHQPATHGRRAKQKGSQKVVKSSQVPQEDMDWGHRPWRDEERVRQLVTSDG